MTTARRLATAPATQDDPDDLAVAQFVVAAKEFCGLFDCDDTRMRRALLLRILAAAVALYGAGLALPEVDPEIDTEEPFFDQGSRRQFRKQLAAKLGAALENDLAGVYFDINEGLFRIPQHAGRI